MELMNANLRRRIFADVTPESCAGLATSLGCHLGFTYTTAASRFCRCDNGAWVYREGPVTFGHAFEARFFGPVADLHWVREGESGHLAILTENNVLTKETLGHFGLKEADVPETEAYARDHTYLLWGESAGGGGEWTKLVTARIGTLWVPFPAPAPKTRLVLTAREYFTTSIDGNVVFAGERLTGIREAKLDDSKAFERSA